MAEYELYLSSAAGERVAGPLTSLIGLEWSIALNRVGVLKADFGLESWRPEWYDSGLRLEAWRSVQRMAPQLLQVFFLLDYGQRMRTTREGPRETAWVRGYDLNHLLTRRIVAAAAGSAKALKTGTAADVMAEYAVEALLADAGRDVSGEFDLEVHYVPGAGETITHAAARGQLLRVLSGCAATSAALGTTVRFWVQPRGANSAVLRIARRPWGADRRGGAGFSAEAGTLYDASWEHDGGDAANYAYVGGKGEGASRTIGKVSLGRDTGAVSRREVWFENTQLSTEASLESWGAGQLWLKRQRDLYDATVKDTPQSVFGRDWALGDLLKAQYRDWSWEAEITAIAGRFDDSGEEVWARCAAESTEITT